MFKIELKCVQIEIEVVQSTKALCLSHPIFSDGGLMWAFREDVPVFTNLTQFSFSTIVCNKCLWENCDSKYDKEAQKASNTCY